MTGLETLKRKIPNECLFLFYIGAVIATDIVPRLGGIDVMGAQWLYLAIVNFVFLVLFSISGSPLKKGFNGAITLFGIFLLFGIVSMAAAINKVESTVVLSRYVIVFITAWLIYRHADLKNKKVRRFLGWAIAVVCLWQSVQVIGSLYFRARSAGFHNVSLHNLTLSGFVSQGNKNIAASDLAMKLPFLLFLVFDARRVMRIVGYCTIFLSAVAIIILGSVSAAGGLVLSLLLVDVGGVVYMARRRKLMRSLLFIDAALIVLLLSISLFLGKVTLGNVRNYSGIADRFAAKVDRNFETDRRKLMLRQAYDYVKAHPFVGCGVGNWKIEAIRFDRYAFDDFRIAKHVHNDFMEIAAETGWGGGAAYIGVFILLGFYLIKYLLSKRSEAAGEMNPVGLVLLSSLGVYVIDALFNFPTERPCSQVNLSLVIGFTAALPVGNFLIKKTPPRKLAFGTAVVIMVPVLFSTFMVFRSMRFQEYFKDDIWLSHQQFKAVDVDKGLVDYPNLTEYALPINCIKARYYFLDSQEQEGLRVLTSVKDPNPALALRADLLAEYYASKKNYDSSFFYAKHAVAAVPRCRLYAKVFLFNCVERKDSNAIKEYFTDLMAHSAQSYLATDWEKYCATYYKCTGSGEKVIRLLDDALVDCPGNQRLLALKQMVSGETEIRSHQLAPDAQLVYRKLLEDAKTNYAIGNYDAAIQCFKKAVTLASFDYSNYENLGLIYLEKKDFTQSIVYFKNVIDAGKFQNGRSEYYCAQAFYNLKNWPEALKYASIAAQRNYPGARALKDLAAEACANRRL